MRKVVIVPPPSSEHNTCIPFPEFPRVATVCLARIALPALSTLRTPEGESDAKGPFVESRVMLTRRHSDSPQPSSVLTLG